MHELNFKLVFINIYFTLCIYGIANAIRIIEEIEFTAFRFLQPEKIFIFTSLCIYLIYLSKIFYLSVYENKSKNSNVFHVFNVLISFYDANIALVKSQMIWMTTALIFASVTSKFLHQILLNSGIIPDKPMELINTIGSCVLIMVIMELGACAREKILGFQS